MAKKKVTRINKERLKVALSTIHDDHDGLYCSGHYTHLMVRVFFDQQEKEVFGRAFQPLNNIVNEDWRMGFVLERMQEEPVFFNNQIRTSLSWNAYIACDIDYFIIKLRSIFDYIAKALAFVSGDAQIPSKSYNKLKNWIDNADNSERHVQIIGEDIAELISSCEWFDDIKNARDLIIHHGKHSIVFPQTTDIYFQLDKVRSDAVIINDVMFDNDYASFKLYAGVYMGYLKAFLEEFSKLIFERLEIPLQTTNNQSRHPGLAVIKNWIEHALQVAEE